MGFLNAGFGAAASAAKTAIGLGDIATGLETGSAIAAGFGGLQQGLYQSQVAQNNAKIAGMNATAAEDAGSYAEQVARLSTGRTIATQKVEQAANGVDVGSGSALAVRQGTQAIGDLDAAMIHYNAAREAFGSRMQAAAFKAQAGMDRMAGATSVLSGLYKGGTSFLAGVVNRSAKIAAFKRSGAY